MLDEGNMEKKPISRHSPVPVKTSTGDKKTDNARFQRTPRRKDNGIRSYQDANPSKKPLPQKTRTASDKRPRPRGYFNDKQRDEVANEIVVEYNSSVSRKDLNQMINFDYGFHRSSYHGTLHSRPRRHHFKSYAAGGVFNKQQYLQANCQFVMKDSGDYSIHVIDPDQPVEWNNIEQLCMSTPDLPLCPICLCPPVAGKITKCGHIYCWSCILHYLALSEKNWHKCPICNEAVHQKDLKSVKTIEVHRYKVGDMIKLNLMRRDKGNTIPVARSVWIGLPSKPFNVKENHMACYSKVVTATPADVQELVTEPETAQLVKQLDEAEESEKCFIESALLQQKDRTSLQLPSPIHKAQEQQQLSSELENLTLTKSKLDNSNSKTSKYYVNAFDEIAEEVGSAPLACLGDRDFNYSLDTAAGAAEEEQVACIAAASPAPLTDSCGPTDQELMLTEQAAQCLELPHDLGDEEAGRKRRPKCSPKNTFYFYQAADGQHIYMHAINARCMVQEYGSLMNCPDGIEATIVELESVTMTEELRKRLRYLSHLPLSAEFKVAELLLKPPIVSKETLRYFRDEIEKRRRIRQKKNREERSRSKRIQEEENLKYGISPVKIVMSSAAEIKNQTSQSGLNIPVFSCTPRPVMAIDIVSPSTSGDSPIASPSSAASSTSDGNQTTSFAQMLKSGKLRSSVGPAQASGSLKPDSALRGHPACASDSDISDNEDKIPVPNFQNSFGDAIQTALDNLEQNNTGTSAIASAGKKKKKMKKLLFTTTMARGK